MINVSLFRMIRPLFLLLAVFVCASHATTARPDVLTSLGRVEGVVRHGVAEYRGIPYADTLTAQDRWTLAKPAKPWKGKRDAADFGGACPQTARFELTEQSLEENCLSLNVSTPVDRSPGERLPVLVWLPGGGFVGGASSLYRLDKLAREGRIVVVSVNYRLGALGFMSHPAQAGEPWNGNLGLEDQRLAMRWVQQNIAAFGGDPGKVTLAGESAGAASVCLHLFSGTRKRGLFQQAIAASYGCLYRWPSVASTVAYDPNVKQAFFKPTWQRMAEITACFDSRHPGSAAELECMRAKPLRALLAAQEQITGEKPVFPFGPKIDSGRRGTVPLPDYARANLKAHFNRVPLLYGGTQDELRLYVAYDVLNPQLRSLLAEPSKLTASQLRQYFGIYYGLDPHRSWTANDYDRILNEYFPGRDATASELGSMFSDYIPVAGPNNCAALAASGTLSRWTTVYQWEFADPDAPVLGVGLAPGKDPRMTLGAVHSSELNYLFPNLSNTSVINAPDLPEKSQRLADKFTQAWTTFVKTGSPRTADTPNWQPYLASHPQRVMRFAPDAIAQYDARARHRCAFWETLDPKLVVQ